MNIVNTSDKLQKALQTFELIDDFDNYVTGDTWTAVATDSGGAVLQDSPNGVLLLDASDGTVADNDETYVHTTKKLFKFQADKPLDATFRVQFSEASTPSGNVIVGFCSAAVANSLQDNGAGPPADYSGAVFFTVDGNTNWQVEKSLSTTQNTVELTALNSLDGSAKVAESANYQDLRIVCHPTSGTKANFMFYIDGILVYKMMDESIDSAAAMHAIIGIKNGSTNEETISIDLVAAAAER